MENPIRGQRSTQRLFGRHDVSAEMIVRMNPSTLALLHSSAERRAAEDPAIGSCSPIPASSTGVGIELAVDELYTDRVGVIVP